jgi:hypothetical protein
MDPTRRQAATMSKCLPRVGYPSIHTGYGSTSAKLTAAPPPRPSSPYPDRQCRARTGEDGHDRFARRQQVSAGPRSLLSRIVPSDAPRALMAGRLEDAESLATRALEVSGGTADGLTIFGGETANLRWEQGRLHEHRDGAEDSRRLFGKPGGARRLAITRTEHALPMAGRRLRLAGKAGARIRRGALPLRTTCTRPSSGSRDCSFSGLSDRLHMAERTPRFRPLRSSALV